MILTFGRLFRDTCWPIDLFAGAFKQQDLMKTAERGMEVYIRQTVPDTYRLVLKEIRQKEIYNLIIDTNPKNIHRFFRSVSGKFDFLFITDVLTSFEFVITDSTASDERLSISLHVHNIREFDCRTFSNSIIDLIFLRKSHATSQDIESYDLEDFKYNNVNITAFRLVDVDNPAVTEVVDQMRKFQNNGKEIVADQMLLV